MAWDYSNTKAWNKDNIDRLCADNQKSAEPAKCFETVMHGKVDWGGGTTWNWQNAINLCAGSPDAALTVKCFNEAVGKKTPWNKASEACSAANIRKQMVAATSRSDSTQAKRPNIPRPVAPTVGQQGQSVVVVKPDLGLGVSRQDKIDLQITQRFEAFEELYQEKMSPRLERALQERERNPYGGSGRVFGGSDCNDSRRDAHPNASEICDNIDNDCDGLVDEGQTLPYYLDADGDTHGDSTKRLNMCPAEVTRAANQGRWLVRVGNDCDDSDPSVWNTCE
ncbi:MAG: putative metal-binding motif-containing protein [Pseudomonadota bacterium]